MNVCLRRLDRDNATRLLLEVAHRTVVEITSAMPDQTTMTTWPAVGGQRIDDGTLRTLRHALLELAADHGFPNRGQRLSAFDGTAAPVLRSLLPLSAHEASQEDGWSWLTCCWLLDIAVWRFGAETDRRRFLGDVNLNTFRRLWWRSEVLGDTVPLNDLGEDELVQIMERPTLASSTRFARTIASEFLDGVRRHPRTSRMNLMRETTKRLLRRTPFIDHSALDSQQLAIEVRGAVDASAAALSSEPVQPVEEASAPALPGPSAGVRPIQRRALAPQTEDDLDGGLFNNSGQGNNGHSADDGSSPGLTLTQAGAVAIDLAARAGQVTNMSLRALLGVDNIGARRILQAQVDAGRLVRRGQKRGTHYTLPGSSSVDPGPGSVVDNTYTELRRALGQAEPAPIDGAAELTERAQVPRIRRPMPTVRDLNDFGLIGAGDRLVARVKDRDWNVTILVDGRVMLDGAESPLRLALLTNEISGHAQSAMRIWNLIRPDGSTVPLHQLRDELATRPGWTPADRV